MFFRQILFWRSFYKSLRNCPSRCQRVSKPSMKKPAQFQPAVSIYQFLCPGSVLYIHRPPPGTVAATHPPWQGTSQRRAKSSVWGICETRKWRGHEIAPSATSRQWEVHAMTDGIAWHSGSKVITPSVNWQPWHFTNESFGLPHAHSLSVCLSLWCLSLKSILCVCALFSTYLSI